MTALGTATIIRGDARALPLADDSVDLIVTSPPYFALRSYQDGGVHYEKQIGSEPTPAEWLDALLEVTRECVRVLKPSGSLWVNLGDKYAGAPSGPRQGMPDGATRKAEAHVFRVRRKTTAAVPTKSLMGMPWRYALACTDQLGLILRAELIWAKPNGLPESVTDRVRRSHETWFHFTLMPRYYSAVDEIREAHIGGGTGVSTADRKANGWAPNRGLAVGSETMAHLAGNPLGKLPGSVWSIPTEPLTVPPSLGVDHFAAFPSEWPKRIIRGWSPAGVCVECGEGRRPIVDVAYTSTGRLFSNTPLRATHRSAENGGKGTSQATITGYACACPEPTAPTTPGVVLDPFGGTGTTAMVAKALGRHGITVDLSADYCRLAEWRCNDRNQLAKVLDLPPTQQQPDTQPSLLDMLPTYP